MATYIPGTTDYVSQFQPFTPDYNFLGNILQQRQSTYDANYNALNQKYGTLLNSDLLREDSLVKRDQFFKMIDQDIKKMSGLDLSLQQNVDASHKVFDSFYQNKDIFKDMVYTKEYKRQLQIADSYKNCIDQEKCGGKYWDVGVNYLNYKADEFKKASKEDMMSMSPAEYIPQINVQEKAMKLAKDYGFFSDKGGPGKIMWSEDGKYTWIQKGGAVLQTPFYEVLRNMLGKDQAIIDMYKAQAYVNRKDYILSNKDRFGGDENLAEDDYFRSLDEYASKLPKDEKEAWNSVISLKAKKELLEKTIEREGTSGDDDLGIDFAAAGLDYDFAVQAYEITQEQAKVAKSVYDNGIDRNIRRSRYDTVLANNLLNREMFGAATGVAALAESKESFQADPYAKSAFDFSLDMQKLQAQYDLMDRNAFRQSIYELSKEEALGNYSIGGSLITPGGGAGGSNIPTTSPAKGTTITRDELAAMQKEQSLAASDVIGYEKRWIQGFAESLRSSIDSGDTNSVIVAKELLHNWLGKAERNAEGQVVKEGYDATTNTYYMPDNFKSRDGRLVGFTLDQALENIHILDPKRVVDIYQKGINAKNQVRSLGDQKAYIETVGNALENKVQAANLLLKGVTETQSQNLKNVRDYMLVYAGSLSGSAKEVESTSFFNIFKKTFGLALSVEGDQGVASRNKAFVKENEKKEDANNDRYIIDALFMTDKNGKIKLASFEKFNEKIGERLFDLSNQSGAALAKEMRRLGIADLGEASKILYDTYLDKLKYVYNQNPSVDGKPLVQPLLSNPASSGFGGGLSSEAYNYEFNTAEFAGEGYQGTLGFINDYLSNPELSNIHLGSEVTETGDIDASQADLANRFSTAVRDELLMNIQKKRMKKEFTPHKITARYLDTALSDENKIGLHVKPSQKFIEEYFTKEERDDNPSLFEGFTMYVPKSEAKNFFRESHKYQPYDVILQHSPVELKLPNAGTVKINKRNPDGSFTVEANFLEYRDGQLVRSRENSFIQTTPADSRGQAVYETFYPVLQEINRYNTEMKETGKAKIYNTNLLRRRPDGSLILAADPDASSNLGKDIATLYQQNVQRNLQRFGQ